MYELNRSGRINAHILATTAPRSWPRTQATCLYPSALIRITASRTSLVRVVEFRSTEVKERVSHPVVRPEPR